MDLYTVSLDLPSSSTRLTRSGTSPPNDGNLPLPPSNTGLPGIPRSNAGNGLASTSVPALSASQAEEQWSAVQSKCLEITSREGCLVSATREGIGMDQGSVPQTVDGDADGTRPISESPVYNYHLSGSYQGVMAARGDLLREAPRDNRLSLQIPRTDLLESPLADVSQVKADVLRRLEDIAIDSQARLSVVNVATSSSGSAVLVTLDGPAIQRTSPNGQDKTTQAPGHDRSGSGDSSLAGSVHAKAASITGKDQQPATDQSASTNGTTNVTSENGKPTSSKPTGPVSYGLETERMCEINITGSMESVHLALRGCLVMQDQLAGLHAEVCEIDYKIQAIVAGRQRQVIQNIQEETATNIYLSTPLVGVLDAPLPGSRQGIGYRHLATPMPPQPHAAPMPLTMQPTGQSMYSMGGPSVQMGMTPHMTGNSMLGNSPMSSMAHGGGYALHPPPNGMHADNRPHQPFQNHSGFGPDASHQSPYHYLPHHQQSPMGPDHSRGMHFNGHGPNGIMYNAMNDIPGPPHHHHHAAPLQINHTGMSSMHSYQPSRINSPMPPHSHLASPMSHHNMPIHGHAGQHPSMGMSPHQAGPYAGQTHLHVGMGGGPMGGRFGNGMSPMGPVTARNGPMDMGSHGHIHHFNGPHPGLSVHSGEQGKSGKANQIWITGEFFGVQRARDMLLNVAVQKHNLVISRDAVVLPRKLDWLLTERLDDIRTIMSDNATYIQVPSVGSQASLITVFGDHRVNIERTIRSIMALACQFYVASFWLLPLSFDVLMPQASVNPAQMQPVLKCIAHATGAEIVFKSNCFEMHGLERQVRAACLMILDLDIVQNFQHEIRFQIELANEHREFISGKKNGKINKIMKMCGVKIKFETFSDYNFLLDISGNNVGSLQGLSMLLEELPAELSFHLPEAYHKRIIGVGGRNIQRIMKAYGVYVKFSNAEEFAAIGGYAENEDNVVARTPAKNHVNLEIMKQAIVDMVNPKDKDYTRETVSIPRRYHRTLLGEKSIFIRDIEQKTSSSIRFPYKEQASDLVTIFGPESQIQIAAAMLLEHVPFEADLHVPPNADLTRLVTSPDFVVFSERVKRDHQIAITPSPMFGQGDEAVFKFRCQRSNIDFLGTARDVLEDWLSQHNIQVYPQNAKKRVDNFADAFPHFNSKLLASGHKMGPPAIEELLPRPRTAVDATNVKALFESPNDANPGFAGPLGLPSTRPPELWQPPTAPTHTHARSETDSVKRDSDPIIQERVRAVTQHVSPHSHSHRGVAGSARTQSLDITSLNFSRSLSGGSNPFGPMPPSPSGLVSSPSTATGPFFPSAHGAVHPNPTARYSVDSIADGLTNIQVSHQ